MATTTKHAAIYETVDTASQNCKFQYLLYFIYNNIFLHPLYNISGLYYARGLKTNDRLYTR